MSKSVQYERQNLPELLQAYYRFLFPHKLFYRWLSYGNVENKYFDRREFSFCLTGDVYVRYQSFSNANELEKAIVSRVPEKIDIGPVYNIQPKDSKTLVLQGFRAEERELVFDIDMTDYDDVRTCCSGADICPKCWPFMTIAAKILNRALRQDFGFKHLLWVYSGRRGIHCWVADERARKLAPESRAAVAEYLTIIEGGEFKAKKVTFNGLNKLHPSVQQSLNIVDDYFEDLMLEKQKVLESERQITLITDLCPDHELKKKLKEGVSDNALKNSQQRWKRFEGIAEDYFKRNTGLAKAKLRHLIKEIKLQLCYPRLDINVTKGLNHLLKTPFSVHPKTGRVCVPIDFDQIDSFDPFSVPIVSTLCKQIDENTDNSINPAKVYEKTDLKESINILKKFVETLEMDSKGIRIKRSDEKMEF